MKKSRFLNFFDLNQLNYTGLFRTHYIDGTNDIVYF